MFSDLQYVIDFQRFTAEVRIAVVAQPRIRVRGFVRVSAAIVLCAAAVVCRFCVPLLTSAWAADIPKAMKRRSRNLMWLQDSLMPLATHAPPSAKEECKDFMLCLSGMCRMGFAVQSGLYRTGIRIHGCELLAQENNRRIEIRIKYCCHRCMVAEQS